MISRLSLYNVGVSVDTFFSNRLVEIRNLPRNLRKMWKAIKRRFYGRIVRKWKDRIGRFYDSTQSKLNTMFDRRDKVLEKYYEVGGSYEATPDLEVKMCEVKW